MRHIGIYNRQDIDAVPETKWYFKSFWDEKMPESDCMRADGTIKYDDENCMNEGESHCFQDAAGNVICPDEDSKIDEEVFDKCMFPDGTIDYECLEYEEREMDMMDQCTNDDGTYIEDCKPGHFGANTFDPCMDY